MNQLFTFILQIIKKYGQRVQTYTNRLKYKYTYDELLQNFPCL